MERVLTLKKPHWSSFNEDYIKSRLVAQRNGVNFAIMSKEEIEGTNL